MRAAAPALVLALALSGCAEELLVPDDAPTAEGDAAVPLVPLPSERRVAAPSETAAAADPDSGIDLADPELDLFDGAGAVLVLIQDQTGETLLLVDGSGVVRAQPVHLPSHPARFILADGADVYVVGSTEYLDVASGLVRPWPEWSVGTGVSSPGQATVVDEFETTVIDLPSGAVLSATYDETYCWRGTGYSATGALFGFDMDWGEVRSLDPATFGQFVARIGGLGPPKFAIDADGTVWTAVGDRLRFDIEDTRRLASDILEVAPFGDTVALLMEGTEELPARLSVFVGEEEVVLVDFPGAVALDVEPLFLY